MKKSLRFVKRDGFALIMALGLMALMVLLIVTLSSLISIETTSSNQARATAIAEQNAYAGLMMAVGQLQQYAGNDQRITASADILTDSTTSTVPNPNWVGVWATADENFNSKTLARYAGSSKNNEVIEKAAALWLVSGNTSSTTVSPTKSISGNKITLVGSNTVKESSQQVQVPLVSIASSSGENAGKYAWWVGDEGIKGNVGFEREPEETLSMSTTQKINIPYRSGFELLRAGTNSSGTPLFAEDITTYTKNDHITQIGQLDYLAETTNPSKDAYHDITVVSRGVMSNTKDGGLRKDLSDYEKLPIGKMFSVTGADNEDGIQWDQVKSFLRMGKELNISSSDISPTVNMRQQYPSSDTGKGETFQHGLYPIPVRMSVYVDAAFIERESGRYGVRLYLMPVIALWNPYDVKLNVKDLRFTEWSHTDNAFITFSVGRWVGNYWQPKPMLKRVTDGGVTTIQDDNDPNASIYRIDPSTNLQAKGTGGNDTALKVAMGIENTVLQPGETIVFTARGLREYKWNGWDQNMLYPGFRSGEGFYFDLNPIDTAFLSPYRFVPEAGIPIEDYYVDLGVIKASSNDKDVFHEWWYMHPKSGTTFMTQAGLNRAGLAKSMPNGKRTWHINEDGRPRAWLPTIRTQSDTSPMPNGLRKSENYNNSIDDWPAYGTLYELKQAVNDQNEDSKERRRQWLGNYNPRAPKGHFLTSLGTTIGTINQSYIGHFRGRSNDLNDNQSDLHYTPTTFGNNLAFGYSPSGPTRTILFHVPRKDVPPSGVGELMHMNATGSISHTTGTYTPMNMIPAYAVGNSLANPHIALKETYKNETSNNKNEKLTLYDYSYLLNNALWDKFFSSNDLLDGKGPRDPRFVPASTTASGNYTYSDKEEAYDYAAQRWLQAGMFNINSTSERAWQTLLASTYGVPITKIVSDNDEDLTMSDKAQFTRMPHSYDDVFNASSDEKSDQAYAGFRALSEAEITTLSRQIVQQIKRRGPFYSVAEFVNRATDANAHKDFQLKGPLQAAIEASNLNSAFKEEIGSGSSTSNDPLGEYENPDALYGAVGANVPGYLSQADLLQKIGNRLSARSDTFIVRSYGEADEAGGGIARAYCEAVVQRIPEYVNDQDKAVTFPPTNDTNRDFGRRFIIRSFRWLTPKEI